MRKRPSAPPAHPKRLSVQYGLARYFSSQRFLSALRVVAQLDCHPVQRGAVPSEVEGIWASRAKIAYFATQTSRVWLASLSGKPLPLRRRLTSTQQK
jgi:hypothetical protein